VVALPLSFFSSEQSCSTLPLFSLLYAICQAILLRYTSLFICVEQSAPLSIPSAFLPYLLYVICRAILFRYASLFIYVKQIALLCHSPPPFHYTPLPSTSLHFPFTLQIPTTDTTFHYPSVVVQANVGCWTLILFIHAPAERFLITFNIAIRKIRDIVGYAAAATPKHHK
jgi:hypothetical protein